MSNFNYLPAEKPTFYFVGVTTSKSLIMDVFPKWMEHPGFKKELLLAAREMFDGLDPYAQTLEEISCIAKKKVNCGAMRGINGCQCNRAW